MMNEALTMLRDHSAVAWLGALNRGESGQGLIEYALLAVLVSIAAITIITGIGSYLPHLFAVPLNAL